MDELPGGLRRVTMPLPTRPGHVHCYLLPVDDGFMLVDTGLGLPDARERWAAELAQLAGPRHHDLRHALPSRPRRRGGRRLASSPGAPVVPGAARRRAVRRRLGERGLVERPGRLVPRHGVPAAGDRGADRAGRASTGRSSGRVLDPELVDDGDRAARLGDRRRPGPRRRAADAAQGRRADRRRPPARADHADGRASGPRAGPIRSATTSARSQRTIELAPTIAYGGHGDPIADPVGRAQRADRPPRRAARRHRGRARHRAAHRRTRCRFRCSATISGRPHAGSPSPRRSPISSGSSGTAGPSGTSGSRRGRRRRLLYCRAVVDELPSSTAAPETGA